MLVSLLFSMVLACNTDTALTEEIESRLGTRLVRWGLEKFGQKGYTVIPNIVSAMPSFRIPEIAIGPFRFALLNMKPRTMHISTAKEYRQNNSLAEIKPHNKMMQLSIQLKAAVFGISGSLNCTLTFRDMIENTSPRIEDLPNCSYQLKVFGISGPVCPSDPGIGAVALDKGRIILMNTIQGTKSTMKTVETVLQSLAGAALNAAKQPVLKMLQATHLDEDFADRCYISGDGLTDSEFAAPADQKNRKDQASYLSKILPPPLKTAYNDEDYGLCIYKEDDPLSSAHLVCEPWQI